MTKHYTKATPLAGVCHAPKRTLLSVCLSAALLTACGGTGQDNGSPSSIKQEFSGAVLDGYLARATVFLDSNNNGTRDAWEAYAFTDNEGFYSFNSNTNTDYCADTATPQEQQYCLVSRTSHTNVVVRVDGGYDVLTGEPFLGQMTRRVNANDQSLPTDSLISPLTSVLTSALTDEQTATMLNALGLQPGDLDTDYLNSDGSGSIDAALLNKALTIHKAVTVLADRLTDTYDEIGENFGTPNDASAAVYSALADSIASIGTLDGALQPNALYQILDTAEEELKAVYKRKDLTLPADMGDAVNPQSFQRIADIVSDIAPVVDALINDTDASATIDNIAGRARALESLVIKAVNESEVNDATIENAVEFFTNNSNEPLLGALIDSLDADTADLGTLSTNDFSGTDFDSVLEIAASSSIPANALPITRVGGTTLRLSDLFLGSAPAKLDDSEVEFYFEGQAEDTNGSFTACVKVIDDANEDGTLGDGNTRGDVADGFWSILPSPGLGDDDTYNLVMTINFLGATYQGIVKAGGVENIGGIDYQAMRFDNDGKLETWYTQTGFVEGGTAPADSADCEARLPSRVGI